MCPVLGKPPPLVNSPTVNSPRSNSPRSNSPGELPPGQISPGKLAPENSYLVKFPNPNPDPGGNSPGAIYRGGVWPGVIHRGAIYRGGIDQRGIFWTPMYPLLRCVAALHKAFIILILPGNHMEHYKLLPFQNS